MTNHNQHISDDEFHNYRENRKARLIFTMNYYSNSDPNEIGDDFGNHKQLTSDEVLNLFDTGYRWALEDIKNKINFLIRDARASGDLQILPKLVDELLESQIQITFYKGEKHYTSTNEDKLEERKRVFNKLRG
jgi:hypothetical protein